MRRVDRLDAPGGLDLDPKHELAVKRVPFLTVVQEDEDSAVYLSERFGNEI